MALHCEVWSLDPNQSLSEWIMLYAVRETNTRPLANASTFPAGRVENWPGQVEACIEQIRDLTFRASVPEV